jgi:hypothetical protein
MHFHLPKPLHGWREFAGEVGIIVLGVLIALGVEQIVQSIHDRRVAHQSRDAINLELGEVTGDLSRRVRTEPCIARRLDEIGAFVKVAAAGKPVKPLLWIGRPQIHTIETAAWNSASQAGRTALFTPKEQNLYANSYALLDDVGAAEAREQDVWGQLRGVEGETSVSPTEVFAIRSLVSQARTLDWRIRVFSLQARLSAAAHGIRPTFDPTDKGSISVCVSSNTPRERAVQIIDGSHPYVGSQFGEP